MTTILEQYYAAFNAGDAQAMLADPDMKEFAQEEIEIARASLDQLDGDLQKMLLPKDPNDERNVILEIRAGTGGDEAALFAADLFAMYKGYAGVRGWRFEIAEMAENDIGGLKEVIVEISGNDVFSRLKYESGVHRVQRVPTTEASGRVHTSAATVAVLPEAEDVDMTIKTLAIVLKKRKQPLKLQIIYLGFLQMCAYCWQ